MALMGGLIKGGVDVLDCGLAPTPAMLFAMKESKAMAGIMVSGSHTPPDIAGLLFFLADTGEMDSHGEDDFERLYAAKPWLQSPSQPKGSIQSIDPIEPYLRKIAKHIGNVGRHKVVVDPGNGATCATLSRALESFGCTVTTINGEPDGRFPSRPPNPQPSTLTNLAKSVRESGADFGVGTDSDGDRALFATADGCVLWGDLTGTVFAKNELEKRGRGTVITTINTSSLVKIVCQEHGGRVIVTKVGPPAIAEALRSTPDAIFATEESGKHIWPEIILYGDAALASGKLLQIMDETRLSLAQLVDTIPKLYQLKSTMDCPDDLKANVMRLMVETWKNEDKAHISTLEGLKVEYPDLTWFLVRASGTEPLLRCSAEGKSVDDARVLLARAEKLALQTIKDAKGAIQA